MPSKPGSKVAISALFLLANKWLAMRTIAGNSSWPPSSNCSLNRRQKRSPEGRGPWKAQARESHLSIELHQPHKYTVEGPKALKENLSLINQSVFYTNKKNYELKCRGKPINICKIINV